MNPDFLQYLYVLDSNYVRKTIIDTFSDFLWTERYCGYGEFEITIPMNIDILKECSIGDYVSIKESDKIMIIDTIKISDSIDNGASIIISGRTLESLLERRIILDDSIGTISKEGEPSPINVQTAIFIILSNNVISPSASYRQIPKFIFEESKDPVIEKLSMESFEAKGENVYDKILSICDANDLGFRVLAIDEGGFQFELYRGIDRTWDQSEVMAVVFSDSYENLINSNYLETKTNLKTAVYVEWTWESEPTDGSYSERETGNEVTEVYLEENYSGLARRETYMRDSTVHDIGPKKNKSAAINQVTDIGKEYLSDYAVTKYFDGETDPFKQFVYGVDYFLGDIVQLENKYGKTGKCRITEIVLSRDSSGANMTPTFENVEGDDI